MRAARAMLVAAMLAAAGGCAADRAERLAAVDAGLARVEARYAAAHAIAQLFAPWLPPAHAAQARRLADAVGTALAAARTAAGLAARRAALAEAAAATDAYAHAVGG